MSTVYVDPAFGSDRMMQEIYQGAIVVREHSPATKEFAAHARGAIEAAFDGMDPRRAQHQLEVESFVDRFAPLKSSFIHNPRSRDAMRGILVELGFDPNDTYIDVPRMRVSTSGGYLTSGVAYAHHPHRDTWYSAPMAQVNWWLPIYDYPTSAGMAFHPQYFSRAVRNGSEAFDYYRWNAKGRAEARLHVRTDTRVQPHAEEPLDLEPELRVVVRPGGIVAFSAAQLHSTCINNSGESRWSVDFRTVSLEHVIALGGASNQDSHPSGTSLRDFVRMRDGSPMPEEVARAYDGRLAVDGEFVYSGADAKP
jgi:hypothetical protein